MIFPTSGGPVASHMTAGFDVHGDLIAAATADQRVQLFNVRTGKEVKMGQGEGVSQLSGQARCVKFAEDEGQMLKLYVSSQGTVQELSWA
jgi:propanediol dehydratase large subunit